MSVSGCAHSRVLIGGDDDELDVTQQTQDVLNPAISQRLKALAEQYERFDMFDH
jgi:hypothetical protein